MPKYGGFSGPYFPVFGLNTEIYSVFSQNTGSYRPEKNSIFSHFSRSEPVSQDVRNFEDKHTPFRELQNLPLKIPEKTIVG